MKTRNMLKIESFVAGKHVSTTRVPAFLVRLATRLLPERLHAQLAIHGIHLREIAAAQSEGSPYLKVVSQIRGGTARRLLISSR